MKHRKLNFILISFAFVAVVLVAATHRGSSNSRSPEVVASQLSMELREITTDRMDCTNCDARITYLVIGRDQLYQCIDLGWFLREVQRASDRNEVIVATSLDALEEVKRFVRRERVSLLVLGVTAPMDVIWTPAGFLAVHINGSSGNAPVEFVTGFGAKPMLSHLRLVWRREPSSS